MANKSTATFKFLINASHYYKNICPEQARFLMLEVGVGNDRTPKLTTFQYSERKFQSLSGESLPEESVCPFCCQWRQPDNHHVRVKPKRKASRRVQQLLRREASRRHLNLDQTRLLRKFHGSRSTLVIGSAQFLSSLTGNLSMTTFVSMATCHTCHRKSKKSGSLRNFLASLSKGQSTPVGTGKNSSASTTPRILSKSASELFKSSSKSTPFRTPRSASTESGISPKQGSATSSFSRLRKLLISGDTQKSKNGTLKDFLSSL